MKALVTKLVVNGVDCWGIDLRAFHGPGPLMNG